MRWLCGLSAFEVYDMPSKEYNALRRGAHEMLPMILFGSDAAPSKDKAEPRDLASLPGGSIVRAF